MVIRRIAGFVFIALIVMVFSTQLASAHDNENHASKFRLQVTGSGTEYQHLRPMEAYTSEINAQSSDQYELWSDDGWCFYTCASPAGLLSETIFSVIPSGRALPGWVSMHLASQYAPPPRKPPRFSR